jgi:hypothetical protein
LRVFESFLRVFESWIRVFSGFLRGSLWWCHVAETSGNFLESSSHLAEFSSHVEKTSSHLSGFQRVFCTLFSIFIVFWEFFKGFVSDEIFCKLFKSLLCNIVLFDILRSFDGNFGGNLRCIRSFLRMRAPC